MNLRKPLNSLLLLIKRNATISFYLFSVATVLSTLLIFYYFINVFHLGWKLFLPYSIADAIVFMAPYWFIPNKWKWLTLPYTFLITAFLLVNILYMKFWGVLLPMTFPLMTGNIDGQLVGSAVSLLQFRDFALFLPWCCQLSVFLILGRFIRREKPFKLASRLIAVFISVLIFLTTQFLMAYKMWVMEDSDYRKHNTVWQSPAKWADAKVVNVSDYLIGNGAAVTLLKSLYETMAFSAETKKLTPAERSEVESFIQSRKASLSWRVETAPQNIIFIIVESLNAEVINKKLNGHEVTPVLNRLINEKGTVFSTGVVCQTKSESSSDGHLIYNLGLLPLTEGSSSQLVQHKDFVSLAQQLPSYGRYIAVFADNARYWNQKTTFRKYGFDTIVTADDFSDSVSEKGNDGAMFAQALSLLSDTTDTFFIELVTASMHTPFSTNEIGQFEYLTDNNLTELVNDFYKETAYFDRELGKFISTLKETGRYDNSLIIIASDHSQNLTSDNLPFLDRRKTIPAFFMALNTPYTKEITKPVAQIDVYPTLIELSGVKTAKFPGLGVSMLDSLSSSLKHTSRIQRISDLILLGSQ